MFRAWVITLLDQRQDLFSYIISSLNHLLDDTGRVGVIVSNAWLGTEWGRTLRSWLAKEFHIEMVVTSGVGRWFADADVVTNLVILQKSEVENDEASTTKFITLKKEISTWLPEDIQAWVTASLSATTNTDTSKYRIAIHTQKEIRNVEQTLPAWSALFTNLSWLWRCQPCLVPVSKQFHIARGERRGWNAVFYPQTGHGIEQEYIRPVLRTMQAVTGHIAEPDSEAFCCSLSLSELQDPRSYWRSKLDQPICQSN